MSNETTKPNGSSNKSSTAKEVGVEEIDSEKMDKIIKDYGIAINMCFISDDASSRENKVANTLDDEVIANLPKQIRLVNKISEILGNNIELPLRKGRKKTSKTATKTKPNDENIK